MKEITQTQLNMENLTRRQIRYLCFRIQTEADGGDAATAESSGVMSFVDEVRENMEPQSGFDGWKMFAKTWDVDEDSPLKVVKRTSSIYTDWNHVLEKEVKELPAAPTSLTPQRDSTGKFVSKKKKNFWNVLK